MNKVIDRGKRIKKLSDVKPVENLSKNLQISPVQKEVSPFLTFLNCKTMHMSTKILLD